jgi:hypothetical protein
MTQPFASSFSCSRRETNMSFRSKPSRRLFLGGLGSVGAASVLMRSPHRALGYQAPSDRPVFATIGLRNQGWTITSKSFKFADFAALVDVDAKVLEDNVGKVEKEQGKRPDAYKDYRQVLDRKDIDAVMIATPDHWHTKIAVEAMEAGKDVYCEKPLTLTIDEGKLIEKVVKETGRVFQVGTMLWFSMAASERCRKSPAESTAWKHLRRFPKSPSPKDSTGTSGLAPLPKSRTALFLNFAKATAAECLSIATPITHSETGMSTPEAS